MFTWCKIRLGINKTTQEVQMKHNNFVLTVEFTNGTTAELFNINGLKETTIEHAANLSFDMVEKKTLEYSQFSKMHKEHWFDSKPYSIRFDVIDSNEHFAGRGVHIF